MCKHTPLGVQQDTNGLNPSARQVAKHTPELAQLIVGSGGVGALVDYISESKGNSRLPGIMALGYIAAFSETLGLAVIAERGLVRVLFSPEPVCASEVWCGLHSVCELHMQQEAVPGRHR